jgi:steroid delta-isomerase-like uncharacterized protein
MTNARELVQRGVDLFNEGDMDGLIATYTDDAIEVFPALEYKGRTAIGERLREQQDAFPDRHLRPLRWVEDGDTVVLEYEFTGTHTGPFRLPDGTVLPATGQYLRFLAVSIFESRDEKCAAHTLYFDTVPMMVQLGVLVPKTPA